MIYWELSVSRLKAKLLVLASDCLYADLCESLNKYDIKKYDAT